MLKNTPLSSTRLSAADMKKIRGGLSQLQLWQCLTGVGTFYACWPTSPNPMYSCNYNSCEALGVVCDESACAYYSN
ncbi:hypothetical protein [Dinghuibacter silviterrae]|uniref:Uncharacterized protein n=1 Tax=Dinghuibacter silviterrae TaxID=1539049 RepID=A0A4R8DPD7_9BACT|nr:hypothetical protein [Dinghuibacter silviterrae]TDW99156.1 hypothetical protein EDB95_0164 [Dinghuibacter silviterrae]